MIRERGNMWHTYIPDNGVLFLFTSNSTLKANGALVMGAGSARYARDNFPGIDIELGNMIEDMSEYGIVKCNALNVGGFQTKTNWRHPSKLGLIKLATGMLIQIADWWDEIHLPYPGTGHGGLGIEQVEPIIMALPDHVHVWTYS